MTIDTITASTSRKINHQVYGGEQFESSDHFVSLSATLDEGEDPTTVHRELMLACKELANTSVSNEILKMQGGLAWTRFFEIVREYRLTKSLKAESANDVTKMSTLQRSIMNELKLLIREKNANNISGNQDGVEREAIQIN